MKTGCAHLKRLYAPLERVSFVAVHTIDGIWKWLADHLARFG